MKIRFDRSYKFSPDGLQVVDYAPGVHDVTERLAECAVADGAAELVEDEEPESDPAREPDPAPDPEPDAAPAPKKPAPKRRRAPRKRTAGK